MRTSARKCMRTTQRLEGITKEICPILWLAIVFQLWYITSQSLLDMFAFPCRPLDKHNMMEWPRTRGDESDRVQNSVQFVRCQRQTLLVRVLGRDFGSTNGHHAMSLSVSFRKAFGFSQVYSYWMVSGWLKCCTFIHIKWIKWIRKELIIGDDQVVLVMNEVTRGARLEFRQCWSAAKPLCFFAITNAT